MTPTEAWAAEYAACSLAHLPADVCRRNADHAERLHSSMLAGRLRRVARDPETDKRSSNRQSTPFTAMPANAAELRQAAQLASRGKNHPRWFAVVALSFVPGGGMAGLRRDRLGPKLAGRILEVDCQTDWIPMALRRKDPAEFQQAEAFGRSLAVRWADGDPLPASAKIRLSADR